MPQPVLLATDILIWLVTGLAIAFVVWSRRHATLRAPWRQVFSSRIAMSAAVVLGAYVLIGLLDSIHFHPRLAPQAATPATAGTAAPAPVYSAEVLSLFDVLVTPLRERRETSYSAPLATHAFSRQTVTLEDGSSVRQYPRLSHGGAHLADPAADHGTDVLLRSVRGLLTGTLVWAILIASLLAWRSRGLGAPWRAALQRLWQGRTRLPWRTAALTLLVLCMLSGILVELSRGYYVLGTDKVGQDVLYQALKSIRTGLVIGTLTTVVMLPLALLLGILAGYHKGWTDDLIQYLYTTLNAIPGVLLIAAAVLMMDIYISNNADQFTSVGERADLRLLFLCLILGITSWTSLCRLLRAETFKLVELEFVQAARALGVSHGVILARHILPNVMHIVLITVVLDFSGLVLAEAVLSYINIGVDPTTESWGNMINSARLELAREPVVWWSLTAAFIFMFVLVLAANLFADAVRDAFDPRTGGRA